MTPSRTKQIAVIIYDHLADYDGFVITHGTIVITASRSGAFSVETSDYVKEFEPGTTADVDEIESGTTNDIEEFESDKTATATCFIMTCNFRIFR